MSNEQKNNTEQFDENEEQGYNDGTKIFCTFRVAGRLFGADILDIREINQKIDFTKISHAPEDLKGYVNIRGKLYLIADMRKIMGFDTTNYDKNSRLILFKPRVADSFGIIVESIGDTVKVNEDEIFDRRKGEKNVSKEILERRKDSANVGIGVCKLEKELMVAVNPSNIVKKVLSFVENEVGEQQVVQ